MVVEERCIHFPLSLYRYASRGVCLTVEHLTEPRCSVMIACSTRSKPIARSFQSLFSDIYLLIAADEPKVSLRC